ncbi:hypothetical protein Syun_000805 [Stephania yunnanensis]|uniref:phosphopyruvate hydratase n=1 Tax=Stephania yunnanensis TaxID=152371 RepID=A0AAP0LDN5_9MAGN
MGKVYPTVSEDYKKAVEKARRKIRALVSEIPSMSSPSPSPPWKFCTVRCSSSATAAAAAVPVKSGCSATVKSVKARQIVDSRGNPTVEVDLVAGDQVFWSAVPMALHRIYGRWSREMVIRVFMEGIAWGLLIVGIIKAKYGQDACNVGDEGGFAPNVQDNREGLILLIIKIGMDAAASEFFMKDGRYDLDFKKQPNDGAHVLTNGGRFVNCTRSLSRLPNCVNRRPLLTKMIGVLGLHCESSTNIQLVGDDLLWLQIPKESTRQFERRHCNGCY